MKTSLLLLLLCLGEAFAAPPMKWTFQYKKPTRNYALGLIKNHPITGVLPDRGFRDDNVPVPADFDLTAVTTLSPILDQGQCGSCVYHSVTANFADVWLLRGQDFGGANKMSAEFLMDSSLDQGSGCNGSYFSATAPVTANGMPLFADCPYASGRKGCPATVALHGKSVGTRLIDTSAKSIITALTLKFPVSNTIGADNNFMGYASGVFNACSRTATNHETEIVGYSCETSRDAAGNCVFDATGNLPPNVGYWKIRNSWGTGWGEQGFYRIKMTDTNGHRCNNVAEEVGIIDPGVLPPVPPTPVPPPVPPTPFNWGIVWTILEILGAISGIAALVLVLVRKSPAGLPA